MPKLTYNASTNACCHALNSAKASTAAPIVTVSTFAPGLVKLFRITSVFVVVSLDRPSTTSSAAALASLPITLYPNFL